MIHGNWITSAINSAASTTTTNSMDLGRVYDKFCVQLGVTNGSPTISVQAAQTAAGTYSTLCVANANGTGSADWITSTVGANHHIIVSNGPYRHVKLVYGTVAQTNSSVAYVCGYRD